MHAPAATTHAHPRALDAYLADPENLARLNLLHTASDTIEHRDLTQAPSHLPGTHEIFHAPTGDPILYNRFLNAFSDDTWVLLNNTRSIKEVNYHASDAILAQFQIVSSKLGFPGILPNRIVLHRVSNQNSLDFIRQFPNDRTGFLSTTELGKCVQHLLVALGMDCSDWHWDSTSRHLTLSVNPVDEPAVTVAPWQDPAAAPVASASSPRQSPEDDLATLQEEWMLQNLQLDNVDWSMP